MRLMEEAAIDRLLQSAHWHDEFNERLRMYSVGLIHRKSGIKASRDKHQKFQRGAAQVVFVERDV